MRTLDEPKGGSLRRVANEHNADGPQASEPTGEFPFGRRSARALSTVSLAVTASPLPGVLILSPAG